jgi:hypothetical protein
MNGGSVGFFCQRDQATLDVSSMRLGDVLVLADDDRTADPELFGLVIIMRGQSLEDVVPFANVNFVSSRILRIRTEQAINTRALYFFTLRKLSQQRSRRNDNLARPIDDLSGQDLGGLAIDQVDSNRFAVHRH